MRLHILDAELSMVHLPPQSSIPKWAMNSQFFSITRTPNELSIVCEKIFVPEDSPAEHGWRAIYVDGTLDFSLVGILNSLTAPLAEAGISIFAISTFKTDYLLVKQQDFARAVDALFGGGHLLRFSTLLFLIAGLAHADEKISPLQQGIELYQAGKYDQAEPLLRKAGENAGVLSIYQKYFWADSLTQLNKPDVAAPILKGILIQKPPLEIKNRTLFLLSQLAMGKSQWRDAKSRLTPLVKKWKSAPQYPQVLHRLLRVEMKLHNRGQVCNLAKKTLRSVSNSPAHF